MLARFAALGGALLMAATVPTLAQAATVFGEDFSGATPGTYSGTIPGAKFTDGGSNIDIVGVLNGSFFTCTANPGGNCIDLVGNQGAGAVITSTPFALIGGTTYTLTFTDLLQGFSAGDGTTATYAATVGGFTRNFTSTGAVANQSFSFTPLGSINAATLAFTVLTSPDSVHGPVLSNILLGSTGVASAVPEPATWAMMIAGFGVVGGAVRRRRAGARVSHA